MINRIVKFLLPAMINLYWKMKVRLKEFMKRKDGVF